ncbi:MAG: ornithine--oxo-acid transaminase [Elusimicrobia bacterium GWA2_69_24]|nr:MAG: ornithine--oxo-acid transaminase [Elusimicrobia bacterium GWA2_69_24]HBL17829.1 ornithine--oxo-acid transaminase [Elusimicrobiota bacterium]
MTAKTQQYIDQDKRYGAQNYGPLPVVLERGEGVFVWDVEGKRYFDMLSAYSAVNQGHNHPKIIAAAKAQMDRLCLTSRAFYNDKMGALLEKLAGITGMEKILLMNSGAEAVETAIKAMRRWGYEVKGIPEGKAEIIVCAENFHGRTSTIVSFSTDPDSYAGYGPKMPGFKVIPYDDPAALEKAITTSTCGFLVEPVQGEAGVKVPSEGFLKAARELCTKHNVLLAVDEIQTGLGRTGKMFCFEHSGIRPDIIVMGKALSGGVYPISAIAADDAVMKVFKPGTHGSTYGGNSLASAIGVAALDVLVGEKLPEKAQKMGEYFRAKLDAIKHPLLKERRGKGLLLALEFTKPIAKDFCKKMMARGLLAKDTHAVTVRFAPPLIITKAQIDEAVAIIEAALQDLD